MEFSVRYRLSYGAIDSYHLSGLKSISQKQQRWGEYKRNENRLIINARRAHKKTTLKLNRKQT